MRKTKPITTFLLSSFVCLSMSVRAQAQNNENESFTTTTVDGVRREVKPGGLYVEPFVSLARDSSSIRTSDVPLANDTNGRVDGVGLGARFGMHASQSIFLGIDGRYQRSRITDSFYQSADGNAYNYGPMIGGQTPWYGIRAWASYVLGGEFDPHAGRNGLDVRFRDPRGYRVGAGLHYLSASVNLEYQDLVYDTTQVQSIGRVNASQDTNIDFETRGFIVSLSFPFEL